MGTNLCGKRLALTLVVCVCALVSVAGQNITGQSVTGQDQDDKSKDSTNNKSNKNKTYDPKKHFAIIGGTAYGPDNRALYGVKVVVHPADSTHPNWELLSDHQGEFAVRVPPGPGDYVIEGQADYAPIENGKIQKDRVKHLQGAASVHIDFEERQDIGLHLK